ncbi:MAG TPA: hypothetical protein VHP54_04945 [Caproiciproducens sp.]|nr:hypothetical protein [Caproiciproducens sp.]
MSKNLIHQKAVSVLLALVMVLNIFQFTGVSAFAEEQSGKYKDSTTLYMSLLNSSRKVLQLDDGNIEIKDSGSYLITQTDNTKEMSNEISIIGGAPNIVLKNVNINVSKENNKCAFSIANGASVSLTLEGENFLTSGNDCAGLQTQAGSVDSVSDASLTVMAESTGSLTAVGGLRGAGIGGGNWINGGIIRIDGGTIMATGGEHGAGIGGGDGGEGGVITINGGTVMATGGKCGAGIGGGDSKTGGTITIGGGMVTATGGDGGAGIGGGNDGTGGTITIGGGIVMATGGEYGAGIGGCECDGGAIIIGGGMVTAVGGKKSAGIGGSWCGSGGVITVYGGTVTATGGDYGSGIGGGAGSESGGSYGGGGTVTISGESTQVTAAGKGGGHDIGSGFGGVSGGSLTVYGGATAVLPNNYIDASPLSYKNCRIVTGSGGMTETAYDSNGDLLATPKIIIATLKIGLAPDGSCKLTAKAADGDALVKKGSFTFEYGRSIKDSGIIAENVTVDSTTGEASCSWDNPSTDGPAVITAKYGDTSNTYDALKTTLVYYSPDAIDLSIVDSGGLGYTYSDHTVVITHSGSYTFTGETTDNKIAVKSGISAGVTLQNVSIDVSQTSGACAFLIAKGAAVGLALEGVNTLKSGGGCAGLQVPASTDNTVPDASFTITAESSGSLTAVGGIGGAGIGGADFASGGTIEICAGTVTATGGYGGAGIGGGRNFFNGSGSLGTGGTITVSGGTVSATGGDMGAGIGGGYYDAGGIIKISGGTVTATGGSGGAGIGGGNNIDDENLSDSCNGGTITIDGGTVNATAGYGGAGIGGGSLSIGGTITVGGGMVTATGGQYGTGIGGGMKGGCGVITVNGGVVTAVGGFEGSGIGGGCGGKGGTIAIGGGIVTATGGEEGAGIGTYYYYSHSSSLITVTISGGVITATGGKHGAGIGGGYSSNGCTVTVSGGTVKATGGQQGAGIGGGFSDRNDSFIGTGGNVTISGENTQVITKGQDGGSDIGSGSGSSNGGSLAISAGATVVMESSSGNTNANPLTCRDCRMITGSGMTETVYTSSGRRLLATPKIICAALTPESVGGGKWKLTAKAGEDGIPVEKGRFTFEYNQSATVNGVIAENVVVDSDTGEASCIWENPLTNGPAAIIVKYRDTTNSYDALKAVWYFSPVAIDLSSVKTGGFGFAYSGGIVTITHDGCYTFTGKTAVNTIALQSGVSASIILQDADIDVSGKSGACAFSITKGAAAGLTLEGENTLKSGENCAGLQVPASTDDSVPDALLTVTAGSSGSLTAVGGCYSTGIGGGNTETGGTVIIDGGDITATGGNMGAGIGGGSNGSGGTITVNGGTVTTTGGEFGAGIGSGSKSEGSTTTINGGTITINGGTVTTAGDDGGAGIGGGYNGAGGIITINGGTVTATGGDYGSGIGGGFNGAGGTTTIRNSTVTATGGENGAGIGGGYNGAGGTITITNSTVTATGGSGGAGIGGGYKGAGGIIVIITGENSPVIAKGQGGGCDIGSGASSIPGASESRNSDSNSKSVSSASGASVSGNVFTPAAKSAVVLNGEARIETEIDANAVFAAAGGATALEPYQMTIAIPAYDIAAQIAKADVRKASLDVIVPSAVTNSENIVVSNITIDSTILAAAKAESKDIAVVVSEETGRQIYAITLHGSAMQGSAVSASKMNFAAFVINVTGGKEILLKQSGFVPGGAANTELFGFNANTLQYVYSVDSVTGTYVPVTTVQADVLGAVNFPTPAGGRYIVLSSPVANALPVKCDTIFPVTVKNGADYTYRITVTSNGIPEITTGSPAFYGKFTKRKGNNVYFTVTANGKSGNMAGIYCTMPGGKAVRIAAAAVK